MSPIRVLIIDDSVVVRRFVCEVLAVEPGLEVAGIAANGRIGLAKIAQTKPDLVILDLEMPEMDGLETLAEIRRKWPLLRVIMYSSLTQRGAIATLDALEAGANDYVTKPAPMGSPEEAARRVRADLIPKILALVPRQAPASGSGSRSMLLSGDPPRARSFPSADSRPRPVEIVAIGTSTGGPNALAALIPTLPADFPAPIVIVQHMPPLFTAMLAERLTSKAAIRVREAAAGDRLTPGHAWIAPGDHHMVVTRNGGPPRIEIHREPPENSCRPSVDVLFRSVAAAYGPGALGIVLTGMGNDGLKGCEHIRDRGGCVLVQDEASSVVWGMPGFVARAGLAERILPLDELGPAIVGRARQIQPAGMAV
jgi:two-component system, chemotaxis family, protein-glutamate methylesterase/glutaminase